MSSAQNKSQREQLLGRGAESRQVGVNGVDLGAPRASRNCLGGLLGSASRQILSSAVLAMCAGGVICEDAFAQEVSAQNSGNSISAGKEIIVTARRREENIQSVPIAVTVVSQQVLEQNNVQSVAELQNFVPSVSTDTGLTRDALNFSIRGQGTTGISGLPGVVAYLNEIPIPTDKDGNLAGGPGLLFDLENVQILKGPQGTLFGRNSTGGAVLLQSARPREEFGGRLQVSAGNYDYKGVEGAVNLPVVDDRLLARVAFTRQVRDGFTRVLATPSHPNGVDADDRDYWAARGTVTFRPNDGFQNDTIVTYSDYDSNGSPVLLTHLNPAGPAIFFPFVAAQFAQQQTLGIRKAVAIDTDLESSGSNLAINNISTLNLTNEITLKNVVGYDEAKSSYAFDLDGTLAPILNIPDTPRNQTIRQFTEELQLQGESFDGRLDWVLGAFYLKQDPPKGFVIQTSTTFGFPSDNAYRQSDSSKAVFAQGSYDLSSIVEGLSFTAGGRYTWDKRTYDDKGGQLGAVCDGAAPVGCDVIISRRSQSEAFTWTLGLDYQATPDTLMYLASRRGYRGSGSNFSLFNGQVINFDPEFVTDAEFGVKSDWGIGQVPIRTNVAIYYQNYKDIQVSQTLVNDSGQPASVTQNAAAARVWGAEFEGQIDLTDSLRLGTFFSFYDFEYTKFAAGVNPAPLEATRTDNRPRWKYGVNARYALPVPPDVGAASLQANWSWQDKNGDVSQPGGMNEAYGVLNLSANWDGIAGSPVDASIFATNVTAEKYTAGGFAVYNTLGYSFARYGEPRMYGLRLAYRFGGDAR